MNKMQIVKEIIFKENDYSMAIKGTSTITVPTAVMTGFKLHMGINSTVQMF